MSKFHLNSTIELIYSDLTHCYIIMAPKTMKAIQIQEFNEPYHVSEVAVPSPKPHQVLVRVKAAGFCHTDLMALNNDFNTKLPFIGSHEPAGIIEEIGSEVTGFAKGDRVGCINFDSVCGKKNSQEQTIICSYLALSREMSRLQSRPTSLLR